MFAGEFGFALTEQFVTHLASGTSAHMCVAPKVLQAALVKSQQVRYPIILTLAPFKSVHRTRTRLPIACCSS